VKATNNTLKMGAGSIPETLQNLHTLKRVSARENVIEIYIFIDFLNQTFCGSQYVFKDSLLLRSATTDLL
jgi:hypothetical protein